MSAQADHEPMKLKDSSDNPTPSFRDGISVMDEGQARAYGCQLIQEAGILLRLPQVVMVTGQMLFHAFYSRVSLRQYSHLWAASSSLFLAAKVEERPRKLRDVVTVIHARVMAKETRRGTRPPVLDYYGSPGFRWKTEVTRMERFILKELGFSIHVEHAHKYILIYVNTMREKSELESLLWEKLLQLAWNFANDCMRVEISISLPPNAIACGCIRKAATQVGVPLPDQDPEHSWFVVFRVSQANLDEFDRHMEQLYAAGDTIHRLCDHTGTLADMDMFRGGEPRLSSSSEEGRDVEYRNRPREEREKGSRIHHREHRDRSSRERIKRR